MNAVQLAGEIVLDSKLKSTRGGDGSMYAFTLETPDKQHHRCVLWDDFAREKHEELRRGVCVTVQGSLNTHSWMQGDERRWMTQIRVRYVVVHPGRRPVVDSHHWGASRSYHYDSEDYDYDDPMTYFRAIN